MGWYSTMQAFFSDVRSELKRTTFPSKKEVQGTTAVVIITVFLFAVYLWIVDTFLFYLVEWVFKIAG